jgi:hypothetical protein
VTILQEAHPASARRLGLLAYLRAWLRAAALGEYTLAMYLASRLLYLVIAAAAMLVADTLGAHLGLARSLNFQGVALTHSTLGSEMSNWDGQWYLRTAATWYMHHVIRQPGAYTTLGFMPMYPMTIWLLAHVAAISDLLAGIAVAMIAGAVATVLVGKLARDWWGEQAARRAVRFWCLFPGTIVFSMVYSEALTVSLIAGAMLLLARRRWLWAGVLAGFATAVAPVDLAALPMCAVAALGEWRRAGWSPRVAGRRVPPRASWRSLLAPLLSAGGAVGFGIYLWIWTGSPLADYTAQHIEWSESTTPLAIPRTAIQLAHQIFVAGAAGHGPAGIDLNNALALLGTAFMLVALKLLWDHRAHVPLAVWVWTVVVCLLALTSANTPPNPRILVDAFPLVLVAGAAWEGRAYRRAMRLSLLATIVLSPITYVGMWLRP